MPSDSAASAGATSVAASAGDGFGRGDRVFEVEPCIGDVVERRRGIFWRQRVNTRRTVPASPAGEQRPRWFGATTRQWSVGSRGRTANAREHLEEHAPEAQMSVRLSTA
jgi:hypothetical protein